MTSNTTMTMLERFRKGAQKAGIQATTFMQTSTNKIVSGSLEFAQTFTLPGEAEKAAKILESFLGIHPFLTAISRVSHFSCLFRRDPSESRPSRIGAQLNSQSCPAKSSRSVSILSLSSPLISSHTPYTRPRHLPSSKSRLRLLRQGRFRHRHRPSSRWFLVCAFVHCHWRSRMGSSDRSGPHRFRHRAQQR
jgi:hypothetical protein